MSQCARRAGAVRRLAIGSWRDDAGGRSRDIKGVGASLERLPLLDSVELLDKASLKYVELLVRHRHVQLKCIHGEPLRATKDTIAFLRAHPELEEISLSTTSVWSRRFAGLRLANIRVLSCRGSIVRAVAFAETFPNLTSLDVRQISPENVYRLIATVGDRLVSLRIEQHVRASVEQPGRMYPTSGYDWRRCARLRHLEMSHRPEWSNDVSMSCMHFARLQAPACLFSLNVRLICGDTLPLQVMRYFTNDPIDAENLPPALEELVWSPAWTRIYTSNVYPDERKRGDLRRFAEAVLRASPTLRLVGYEWVGGQICSCWLASQGLGLRENLDEGYSSRSRACNG